MTGLAIEWDFRNLTPATQAELRRIAVAMVRVGKTRIEAAATVGVNRRFVGRWVKVAVQRGEAALAGGRAGRRGGAAGAGGRRGRRPGGRGARGPARGGGRRGRGARGGPEQEG